MINFFRYLPSVCLKLLVPFAALATATAAIPNPNQLKGEASQPIEKVRAATARFRDLNVALAEGFVQGTPCVSGPDTGAMGVHFVMPSRIAGGVLQADQPEAVIYEPRPVGAMRLVGVEYIDLAQVWPVKHPEGNTCSAKRFAELC